MIADRPNVAKNKSVGWTLLPVIKLSTGRSARPTSAHCGLLVCLALLPFFMAADDSSSARRQENLRRVGDMTPTERQRLEENYWSFQKLPPDEQARLRKLQADIENDPELKSALKEYETWANTLSPGQRNELRRTTDPRERMNLIEDFRHDSPRGRPDEPPPDQRSTEPRFPNSGLPLPGRTDRVRLIEKLLGRNFPAGDRMASSVPEMAAIVQVLEQQLPTESRTELDMLDPFSRKVRVVRLTMERHPLGPPPLKVFGGPESPTFEKVLSALPDDGQVKQFVQSRPNPEVQRSALFMALIRGLSNDLLRTIEDQPANSETLRRYSESLPPPERQRLDNLGRDERFLELQLRYFKEQIPGIREFQEILTAPLMDKFFRETLLKMQNLGPRGSKGQFGPPDGADRPFNNPRSEK